MNDGDKLGDEPIELDTTPEEQKLYGNNKLSLGIIDGYDITVALFRNNITGSYMFQNSSLPVCSLQFRPRKNMDDSFARPNE